MGPVHFRKVALKAKYYICFMRDLHAIYGVFLFFKKNQLSRNAFFHTDFSVHYCSPSTF